MSGLWRVVAGCGVGHMIGNWLSGLWLVVVSCGELWYARINGARPSAQTDLEHLCKMPHIRTQSAHNLVKYIGFNPFRLVSSPSAVMAGMHSFGSVLAIKH